MWADKSSSSALARQLAAARKELVELKSAKTSTPLSPDDAGADDPNNDDLKAAREEIAALRALDSKLHGLIQGGYAAALAAAEAKRDACLARQRGGLPLKTQLSKAQAYVESCTKRHEAEKVKAAKIAAQQAELAQKALEQEKSISAAETKMAAAKAELAAITSKLVEETGKPDAMVEVGLSASDTAMAMSDLCKFAADPAVQRALVSAGLPADQQDRVAAALRTLGECKVAVQQPGTTMVPNEADIAEIERQFENCRRAATAAEERLASAQQAASAGPLFAPAAAGPTHSAAASGISPY